jgi:chromosome segregation ATPase
MAMKPKEGKLTFDPALAPVEDDEEAVAAAPEASMKDEFEMEKLERVQQRITAQNIASVVILLLIVAAALFFYADFSKKMNTIQNTGTLQAQDLTLNMTHVSDTLMEKLDSVKSLLDRDIDGLRDKLAEAERKNKELEKRLRMYSESKMDRGEAQSLLREETGTLRKEIEKAGESQKSLGRRQAGIEKRLDEETASLAERLTALGDSVSGMSETNDQMKNLGAALRSEMAGLSESKVDAATVRQMLLGQVDALDKRLTKMEQSLLQRTDSIETRITSLANQIQELETRVRNAEQKARSLGAGTRAPSASSPARTVTPSRQPGGLKDIMEEDIR